MSKRMSAIKKSQHLKSVAYGSRLGTSRLGTSRIGGSRLGNTMIRSQNKITDEL